MDDLKTIEEQLGQMTADVCDHPCPDAERLAALAEHGPDSDPGVEQHLLECSRCRELLAVVVDFAAPETSCVLPLNLVALTHQAQNLFQPNERNRLDVVLQLSDDRVTVLRNSGEFFVPRARLGGVRKSNGEGPLTESVRLAKNFARCRVEMSVLFPESERFDLQLQVEMSDQSPLGGLRCSLWRQRKELQSSYFRTSQQLFRKVPAADYRLVLDYDKQFIGEIALSVVSAAVDS